jgi:sulfide:quinone oxidoreductase
MKKLVIIGAGTGGTALANRLSTRLSRDEWEIAIVDPAREHLYQPGLLFVPFGAGDEDAIRRPRERTIAHGVQWVSDGVRALEPVQRRVRLESGATLDYDLLVIASGSRIRPDLTPGLQGEGPHRDVLDFYTLAGARRLREELPLFTGGRLVVNVVEQPIKCPVAPLEFLFLADAYFRGRGMRERVELVYATPLDGAFTKPIASKKLGHLLEEKGIRVEAEFACGEVDRAKKTIRSFDDREIAFDLLVTVPTHSGAAFVETSGIGDELAFVPTDRHTLAARKLENVFVLGDATDVPTSKAGSVAHFEAELLADNLVRVAAGQPPEPTFDGHSNCFIETGDGRAMLIDFNYDVEPLPGRFPTAAGPLTLLEESRANHLGKLAFRWMYWHRLLPAKPIPISPRMSMAGKRVPALATP